MPIEKQVSPMEARDNLGKNENVYAIDLRTKTEFELFHVKGFDHIPFSQLSKNIPQIEDGLKVYLMCGNGTLSKEAQLLFEACGIESYVVRGGIETWRRVIDPEL